MKNKIMGINDYKDELANIVETRGFSEEAENLLFSMLYKAEDGYANYEKVKREVPEKLEFIKSIVKSVRDNCSEIIIAKPNTELANELNETKCKILSEDNKYILKQKVISFPNEKTLLYGIAKAGINNVYKNMRLDEKSILTAIYIGKCISMSELIRDFSGWSWSILKNEIESSECNIIYIFLSYLLGYKYINSLKDVDMLKMNLDDDFFQELKKVSVQFYLSYDKKENENVLANIANCKEQLKKMKNQVKFQEDITNKKKQTLATIKHIDELLNNSTELKKEYINTNNRLPNEKKIFSVSTYEELIEKQRENLIKQLAEYNRIQTPSEFEKIKEGIQLNIKFYETKTDITRLQNEFLKCFYKKAVAATDKKQIVDLIYETRYLNFIPNCNMNLNAIEEVLIPKAIKYRVINPISNNDLLDYKILKGIFNTQVISLEGLYIKLSQAENGINVDLYDGDVHDRSYIATTPEGSNIKIRRTKKTKIFI